MENKQPQRIFKELAFAETAMGELSLRLRTEPKLGINIYEIKLNDEFLMSSLFTTAEIELARLALATLDISQMDVVVGGLGLGYTAQAALENERVESLIIVEALGDVIEWHREQILPLGAELSEDKRCRMLQGDFFAMAAGTGFDSSQPGRKFHAILLDIDHAPDFTLHNSHDGFYTDEGLKRLSCHLHPGGVFALWSNNRPDDHFMNLLQSVFPEAAAHVVEFDNPLIGGKSSNTVYICRTNM